MGKLVLRFGNGRLGGIVCLLIGGYVAFLSLRAATHEIYRMACFQETTATVTEYVAPTPAKNSEKKRGTLAYRFEVNGLEYSGRLDGEVIPSESPLHGVFDVPHAVGDSIEVYYNPADPSDNRFFLLIEPIRFIALAFCVPFVLFGVVQTLRPDIFKKTPDWDMSPNPWAAAFVPSYAVLSIISGIGLIVAATRLPWYASALIAIIMLTVVAPGGAWMVARWLNPIGKPSESLRERYLVVLRKNRRQSVFLSCFAVFWWSILSVFLWGMGSTFAEYVVSGRYHATEGRIAESRLEKLLSRKGSANWRPAVAYTYTVGQTEFTGRRIVIGVMPYSGPRETAEQYLAAYAEGSKVTVLYDPQDPKRVALDLDFWRHQGFFVFFLLPFIGIGLFLASLAIWSFRSGKVIDSVPSDSRLAIVLIVWFVSHILSILVLGFFGATNPENADWVWIGVGVVVMAIALAAIVGPAGGRGRNSWR